MDLQKVKKEMMELWSKTFHDSNDYVALIFDNYFNENYIVYREEEGKIVSALLGIPYIFGDSNKGLRGLYLCGLATGEDYRRKGYMNSLLEEINENARLNFDFTFLIPSNELIADYYRRHGYFNSFFRMEERFTSVHDFKNDFFNSLLESDERIRKLKKKLFDRTKIERFDSKVLNISEEDLIRFISIEERKKSEAVNLIHTYEDLRVVIKENEISGNHIFVALGEGDKISGVAFVVKSDIKRISIPAVFVSDQTSYYVLMQNIKNYFKDYSMSIWVTSINSSISLSLIQEVYGAENPGGESLETLFGLFDRPFNYTKLMKPYGMVRLLNYKNILQYIAALRHDVEFNVRIKDNISENNDSIVYKVKNGEVKQGLYNGHDKNILTLTSKEFSEIVLRKKDANNLIMEAFGIPRLQLEMYLMLD